MITGNDRTSCGNHLVGVIFLFGCPIVSPATMLTNRLCVGFSFRDLNFPRNNGNFEFVVQHQCHDLPRQKPRGSLVISRSDGAGSWFLASAGFYLSLSKIQDLIPSLASLTLSLCPRGYSDLPRFEPKVSLVCRANRAGIA